ncbi:MAG TPA: AMP-binding protein [Actinomycetota bacterium]|nr:AMP-binding protein [Actinomycetota bacterium]
MPAPPVVELAATPGPAFARALAEAWVRGEAVFPRTPGSSGLPPPGAPRVPPGTAVIIPTSGTTGVPKAAVLSHDAIEAAAHSGARRLGMAMGDRWLVCLPLQHIAGVMVLVRAALAARRPLFVERVLVSELATMGEIDFVSLVPSLLTRLLDEDLPGDAFGCVLLGGGPIPPGLLERAARRGLRVVTTYGMTETCGGVVYDGLPLKGTRVRAVDGHLEISGPTLMTGYLREGGIDASEIQGGWFRTSDLGDVDGRRVKVHGRVDDVIVTGGEKVRAAEVEALIAQRPDVADVCVAGRVDARWGERVVAFVVPRGPIVPTRAVIRAHVKALAPAFVAPQEVVIVSTIPRLPSGVPARRALLDQT